jgi:hypothetical protein
LAELDQDVVVRGNDWAITGRRRAWFQLPDGILVLGGHTT